MPNTTLRKAADWARQKRHEVRTKRALELIAAGATATPEYDPRLEACVFEGICMSRPDAIQDQRFRACRPRRYTFANQRGILVQRTAYNFVHSVNSLWRYLPKTSSLKCTIGAGFRGLD